MLRLILLGLVLAASPAVGAEADVVAETTTADPDDFGSPGFLILLALICLAIFGVGIVLGLVGVAACGVLIGLGILSTSVAIAYLQRNPITGLRALITQVGGVAGAICGAMVGWFAHPGASITHPVWIGTSAGLLFGLLVGFVAAYSVSWLSNRLLALGRGGES